MSSSCLAAIISIESNQISNPPPVYSKKTVRDASPRETDPPVDLEMYPISTTERSRLSVNTGKPKTPLRSMNEALPDSSNSPPSHASEQIQTIWNPYKNRFRVMASCMTVFANGMNDSAPGALIASIERSVLSLPYRKGD